ncbi:hypothetical protein D3C71_1504230 [compost metagenome]
MPVRERIGAVVRIDLALADRHTRQAGTALRVKPLAATLDIAVRSQQFFNVMAAVELIDHRRGLPRRRYGALGDLRCRRRSFDRPRARRFSIALEEVPILPNGKQFGGQHWQTVSGVWRGFPSVRLTGARMNRRREYVLHQTSSQFKHGEAFERLSFRTCSCLPGDIALLFRSLGLLHQAFKNRTVRVIFIRP